MQPTDQSASPSTGRRAAPLSPAPVNVPSPAAPGAAAGISPSNIDIEAMAKAHCDYYGGNGWWEAVFPAQSKPQALEAMRAAIAAIQSKPVLPTHIEVAARVRYWEDAFVNGGQESNDNPTIPLRDGDEWCARINLEDGSIIDWPEGVTADIHYKVCDEGEYWLTTTDGIRLMKWKDSYVPGEFLCPTANGYGDYIILRIGADGKVLDWTVPSIDPDEWEAL